MLGHTRGAPLTMAEAHTLPQLTHLQGPDPPLGRYTPLSPPSAAAEGVVSPQCRVQGVGHRDLDHMPDLDHSKVGQWARGCWLLAGVPNLARQHLLLAQGPRRRRASAPHRRQQQRRAQQQQFQRPLWWGVHAGPC